MLGLNDDTSLLVVGTDGNSVSQCGFRKEERSFSDVETRGLGSESWKTLNPFGVGCLMEDHNFDDRAKS